MKVSTMTKNEITEAAEKAYLEAKPREQITIDYVATLEAVAYGPIPSDGVAITIDYETFYDDKCTAANGIYTYVHAPRFEHLCIGAAWARLGDEQAGGQIALQLHEISEEWWKWASEQAVWVSHNFAFDFCVHLRAIELGLIPAWALPRLWVCTQDMASWTVKTRSLADTASVLLGVKVEKTTRTNAKGKRWADLDRDGKTEGMLKYCAEDARIGMNCFLKMYQFWPEQERMLAAEAAIAALRGFRIDKDELERATVMLKEANFQLASKLPWVAEGKQPLSTPAFKKACISAGLNPPASLAKSDESAAEWIEEHSHIDWVDTMRKVRKVSLYVSVLDRMLDRSRAEEGEVVSEYAIKYAGAHKTQRDSGDGGLNLQSLAKESLHLKGPELVSKGGEGILSIDVRNQIKARAGHTFIISDLAQIEPRLVYWNLGLTELLEKAGQMGVYEAYARVSKEWTDPAPLKTANKKMYAMVKAKILGLHYGLSPMGLRGLMWRWGMIDLLQDATEITIRDEVDWGYYIGRMAKTRPDLQGLTGITRIEAINAFRAHRDYHVSLPQIKAWHAKLSHELESAIGGTYVLPLPSGRCLRYYGVYREDTGVTARVGKDRRRVYGGLLSENWTQATARDILAGIRAEVHEKFHKDGVRYMFNVHDEGVWEVPLGFDGQLIADCFHSPVWAPDLPVACEWETSPFYKK